jgi:hypothetical protein
MPNIRTLIKRTAKGGLKDFAEWILKASAK